MTITRVWFGIDATTPAKVSITTGDYLHVYFGEGLAVHGNREEIVALFHRALIELAPIEEQLHAEQLIRDSLGLELEPSS